MTRYSCVNCVVNYLDNPRHSVGGEGLLSQTLSSSTQHSCATCKETLCVEPGDFDVEFAKINHSGRISILHPHMIIQFSRRNLAHGR